MRTKDRIEQDLKAAMLAGDKPLVSTLRGLKSAILYAEVEAGKRADGLGDTAILAVLFKEAKKRQESADLYIQGNDQVRADAELTEKTVIEKYLPVAPTEEEIKTLIDRVVEESGEGENQNMGQIIGKVKASAPGADGSIVARLVKEALKQ